jgi:hypothetical protein
MRVDASAEHGRAAGAAKASRLFVPLLLVTLAFPAVSVSAPPAARTVIDNAAAAARLQSNGGITLQWIGFTSPARGHVRVSWQGGWLHLSGGQKAHDGPGRLALEGDVVRIGARQFTFRGKIVITDTPDGGRRCVRDGTFEFRVTGQRRYWRLQQMEMCDGLTDYVDIYY